ncbi:C2H2 type zinc finger domain protein [Aspergillus bombycis]|uniref:C2H2 type zinc finger domain protein n=1 Tax=Aspergillus bombycis TaxID=109264 RepID=A0A1F8ACW4_9EURO|nr:C2H2 type zinc finger domain protein [Aspergillus bombycis]OGM49584.1 C2H2 type zinc finger domain protein [Aspergillus bombycis]
MLARYHPGDLADFVWVGIEEVKRFDLALFRVCKSISLDTGRTHLEHHHDISGTNWQVTASELQFPVPKNDLIWNAVTANEWKSATTEGMERVNLSDSMQSQWISNSTELLQLT